MTQGYTQMINERRKAIGSTRQGTLLKIFYIQKEKW
jgi:hypothetical protein